MITIVTKDNINSTILGKGLTVLDCYSNWCAPCHSMMPIYEKVSKTNPQIMFGMLDVEENNELANKFGVRSLPTFLFFKNGKLIYNLIGKQSETSFDNVIQFLSMATE